MASIDFPEYLKQAMENAGYPTGADVERGTGGEVDKGVVYRWLRGEGQAPTIAKLRPVAKLLGIPLLEMLVGARLITAIEAGFEDDPKPPPRRPTFEDDIRGSTSYSPDMKDAMISLLTTVREEAKREQEGNQRH